MATVATKSDHARGHEHRLTCVASAADDCGDYVVVTNASKVAVTGRKAEQKLYRHHTGFPGGLREIPYKTMMERKPEEVSGVSVVLFICCCPAQVVCA